MRPEAGLLPAAVVGDFLGGILGCLIYLGMKDEGL